MSAETAGPVVFARISAEPITVSTAADAVSAAAHGAVVTFAGVVRDHDEGRGVTRLSYSAHPSAAEAIAGIAAEVAERHPGVALACEHRVGELGVGDVALAAAAASAHRREAFEACSDLVDAIKAEVPIWKEQWFRDGSSEWVAALG